MVNLILTSSHPPLVTLSFCLSQPSAVPSSATFPSLYPVNSVNPVKSKKPPVTHYPLHALFYHFAVNDFAILSSPATFHLSPVTASHAVAAPARRRIATRLSTLVSRLASPLSPSISIINASLLRRCQPGRQPAFQSE